MAAVDIEAEDSEPIRQPWWEGPIRDGQDITQLAESLRRWGDRFPPKSYEAMLFRRAVDAIERCEMPVRRVADREREWHKYIDAMIQAGENIC